MLRTDPIVLKYPQYLPTEDEVKQALELLKRPEHQELARALAERVCIAGSPGAAMWRFCWQAREDHKYGSDCAEGAIDWLRRSVAARDRLRVDSLLASGPFTPAFRDMFMSAMPFSVHGTDRQGHPVLITRYGSVDLDIFRRLWAEGEAIQQRDGLAVNATVLFHIRTMEYLTKVVMAQESERQGRVVDRILAVMDMGGLGMRHVNSPLKAFLGSVAKESVPLFPETLHATVLAHVPWVVAKAAWPVAKSLLHPVTQAKFTILSSTAEVSAKLVELIAPENVPPYFGGRCGCAECAAGKLRGGSLWAWEEENSLSSAPGKAHQPAGPHHSHPERVRRYQPAAPELAVEGGPATPSCCPQRRVTPPPTPPQPAAMPASPGGKGDESEGLLIATDNMAEAREPEKPPGPARRGALAYAWALLPITVVAAVVAALFWDRSGTHR